MNVSGIRPISGFYRVQNDTQIGGVTEVTSDLATQAVEAENNNSIDDLSIAEARSKQTFKAADLAEQYDSRQTYEMKGADSDLRTLDIEKAISAMQKDSVLQQYQYFVGNNQATNAEQATAANQTRAIENFEF